MKKRKTTAYQRLQKAQTRACKTGTPAAKKAVAKAKVSYINSAVKGGKSKGEATAVANRVTAKC